MCSSPVPLIICINDNEESFKRNNLSQNVDSIFVFIDSKKIYVGSQNEEVLNLPTLDFAEKDIYYSYQSLNYGELDMVSSQKVQLKPRSSLTPRSSMNSEQKKARNENPHYHEIEKVNSETIFRHFRDWLINNVVCYMEHFKGFKPSRANHEEMSMRIDDLIENDNLRKFFYMFSLTQSFASYPDSISSVQIEKN